MADDAPHDPDAVDTGSGRLSRVPNAPKTPIRGFRIPTDLYLRALAVSKERGESLSQVVRAALERYVRRYEKHADDED